MNQPQKPFQSLFLTSAFGFLISLFLIFNSLNQGLQVNSVYSGLYLLASLTGYTGIIWILITVLNTLLTKVSKSFLPAAFTTVFALIILFLDLKIYGLFKAHISKQLLEYVINEAFAEVIHDLSKSYKDIILVFIISFFAIFLTYRFIKLLDNKFSSNVSKKHILFSCISLFFLFSGSQLVYAYADVINYIPIKKWTRHIPLYYPLTARRALLKTGLVDASKIRSFEMKNHIDSSINYPTDIECSKKLSTDPNIIWLFIDSWRLSDFNKKVTPNIYKWSQQKGILDFKDHYATGNETAPSLTSIFYGTYGFYLKSFTESGVAPLFFKGLLKKNYSLNIQTSWALSQTSLSKTAFKEVPHLTMSASSPIAWEADKNLNTDFFKFLDNRDPNKPYFSFLIYDSAHDYSIPPEYETPFKPYVEDISYLDLNSDTDPLEYHNRYLNSLHYIDSLIDEILDSQKIIDENRPTIILVSSDHGEQFNDYKKNFWRHSGNFSKAQVQVPLIIKWDSVNEGAQKLDLLHTSSHYDLSKTFLNKAINCKVEENSIVGTSLFSKQERFPIIMSSYSKHGILTKERIYSYEPGLGYEIFDHRLNQIEDEEVPKAIFKHYLKASTKFYK